MLKKLLTTLGVAVLVTGLSVPMSQNPSSPFAGFFISDVEAKSFGGSRSFGGRSSFRSSSSRSKPSFSSKSKSKSSSKPKSFSSTKKPTSAKTAKAKPKTVKGVGKNAISARTQKAKFKKAAVTPTSGKKVGRTERNKTYNTRYNSNPVYGNARSYDSGTYYTRRGSYYGGYNPPMYVYGSSSSFGMWDTIFLYHILSSNNSSQFAHNHQNDADYRAWRADADRLAADNADLRNQLAAMDTGTGQYDGQATDAGYLPTGVDADIALSSEARTAQLPELRVCVGSRSGAYFRVAAGVLAPSLSNVNVTTVETAGTGEILKNIADGTCDAGFVQGDGYWNYVEDNETTVLPFERVFSPYRESVHLICHEDGVKGFKELNGDSRVWFPKGSGAAETWRNILGENGSYSNVRTALTDDSMDVTSNEEALLKTTADKNSCMLYVSAEGSASKFMRNVEAGAKNQNLVLREIDDRKSGCSANGLATTTDPSGTNVYKMSELNSKHYPGLLRDAGWFGAGNVDTLTVNADFIVSNAWKASHKKAYPILASDLMGLTPEITSAVQ